MKKVYFLLIAFTSLFVETIAQMQVKVMSYNIRLDVASDGDNRWDLRKDKVASLMNYYEADFIGGQEVQHHQLQYLLAHLPAYDFIGVGRDDGKQKGEYSCLLYKKEIYTLAESSTFWLSKTPGIASKGWDAALPRVCTYGLFQHKKSKRWMWVFNTHFDHIGKKAREESAKLIWEKIKTLNEGKNYPVLLMGDFNSTPDEDPVTYLTTVLNNARTLSKEIPYGPAATWNGFQFDKIPDGCIDYVFVSKHQQMQVKKFATITDSYELKYPSDHFPVMATIVFKKADDTKQ